MQKVSRVIKTILIFTLLVLLDDGISFGQTQTQIDSLERALVHAKDTQQLDILLTLSSAWKYLDPAKSRFYASRALTLARQKYSEVQRDIYLRAAGKAQWLVSVSYQLQGNNDSALIIGKSAMETLRPLEEADLKADVHNTLGIIYDHLNQVEKALQEYDSSTTYVLEIGNQDKLSAIHNNIGFIYQKKGDYPTALKFFEKSLELSAEIGSEEGRAYALYNIAVVNDYQGDLDSSLARFFECLEIREKLDQEYEIASTYNGIGIIYRKLGNLDGAIAFYQKSLEIKEELGNLVGAANSHNNIGVILQMQEKYDQALAAHKKALPLQKEAEDKIGLAKTSQHLGQVMFHKGNLDEAIKYYEQGLEYCRQTEDKLTHASLLLDLADAQIGQNNFDKAISSQKSSLAIAAALGAKELTSSAYRRLSITHQKTGNYREALMAYQKHAALQDTVFNEDMNAQIANMQTKYETAQKERQILSQETEIAALEQRRKIDQQTRLILVTVGSLLLILLLVIYNRYQLKRRAERVLAEKNEIIQYKNEEINIINEELEKRMLRAQMDPHFIFNSLNSIQHFITINDQASALKYLSKFSKLIRRVLENSVNQKVSVADEMKFLDLYLQLEALRLNNKFEYEFVIDPQLDIYEHEIPFLLIQPYVENAIVHGLRHIEHKGKLSIRLQKIKDNLICTIEDNGIGRDQAREIAANKSHHSRAMPITSRRLALLNAGSSSKTTVTISDLYSENQEPSGTKVEIIIPLEVALV